MTRKQIEVLLKCGQCDNLDINYRKEAYALAVKFTQIFSINGSGYELDTELVQRRIENLMEERLNRDSSFKPEDFCEYIDLPTIFNDVEAVEVFIDMVDNDEPEYFYFAQHFFASVVVSYINHHQYAVSSLELPEVMSVLYEEVFFALKRCAEKRREELVVSVKNGTIPRQIHFKFETLKLLFRAAINKLAGTEKLPFTLNRKDQEQYERFRAEITNPCNAYTFGDTCLLSEKLNISESVLAGYWELFDQETRGFISTSILSEKEYGENAYGAMIELGFEHTILRSYCENKYEDVRDQMIFEHLVQTGNSTFRAEEIKEIGTTRYRIKQIIEDLRTEWSDSSMILDRSVSKDNKERKIKPVD